MKTLLLAAVMLVMVGCQGGVPTVAGEFGRYLLIRGEAWRGVEVGGQPPRTASTVCYRSRCYRLIGDTHLPVELRRKYRLRGTDFAAFSAAQGVRRQGDTLQLPADIGWWLFNEARLYEQRENSKDSRLRLRP